MPKIIHLKVIIEHTQNRNRLTLYRFIDCSEIHGINRPQNWVKDYNQYTFKIELLA